MTRRRFPRSSPDRFKKHPITGRGVRMKRSRADPNPKHACPSSFLDSTGKFSSTHIVTGLGATLDAASRKSMLSSSPAPPRNLRLPCGLDCTSSGVCALWNFKLAWRRFVHLSEP